MNAVITKKSLYEELTRCKVGIQQLLPVAHRDQVERFIARAVLTFLTHQQQDKIAKCTLQSIVQCVQEAAERGFALDNHFAYVIPYNNKKLVNGNDEWVWEAQCQFDYKALIATARRGGCIKDARAQIVYANDEFDQGDENGEQFYRYRPAKGEKGEVIGAYAVATLPGGGYRFAWMDATDLERVRAASKSPESPAWKNWKDRMYCKAVLKRVLNGLQDDPGLVRILELDNREYDMDRVIDAVPKKTQSQQFDELAAALGGVEQDEKQLRIEQQPEAEEFVPSDEEELPAGTLVKSKPKRETVPAKTASVSATRTQPAQRSVPPRPPQRPTIGSHQARS